LTWLLIMHFGWDPPRSERNARERALPFAIAMALFDGPTIEFDDRRQDYGERRIIAYGSVGGRFSFASTRGAAITTTRSGGSSACARPTRVRQMPTALHSRSELDLAKVDWHRVDATSDKDIASQAAKDDDTAPVFTAAEILAAGRRITADEIEDVRALRTRLGLSQEAFAARYGFSVDAIRQYESRRRVPTGPVRTLLRVIAIEPDAVTRALAARER
jgi:putative transcriptional regulator